jgi:hypothetical protein
MLDHGAKGASYGAVRALAKNLEALGVAERIEGERVRWLYDLKSIGEVALGQEEKLRAFTTKGSSPRYIAASLTAQPPQPLTTAAPEAGEVLLSTKNGRLVLRHGRLDVIVDSQATLKAVLELLQG